MHTNIVGGHAPTQPWPAGAKVALLYDAPDYGVYDYFTCGASQYSGYKFKTAAHCSTAMPDEANAASRADLANRFSLDSTTARIPFSAKRFKIRVGSDNREEGGITANVKVTWVSPRWNWGQTPGAPIGDVAQLTADRYVDTYALPIAPRAARPGDTVYELGWGVTEPNGQGPVPTQIRELKTKILPDNRCASSITGAEKCVNNPGGVAGACYGDSGGPLGINIDGVMYDAGIASRGLSTIGACGDTPGVYTSTPEYAKDLAKAAIGAPAPGPAAVPRPGHVTGLPVR